MQLSYERLKRRPITLLRLTGLKEKEFEKLISQVEESYQAMEAEKKRVGRLSHLPTLADKLLCILVYYRCYITHEFLGYIFNLHKPIYLGCSRKWNRY